MTASFGDKILSFLVAGCIKNKRHKKTTDGGNQLFDEREFII